MTTVPAPMCMYCRHYIDEWRCNAYPGHIPHNILDSEHDHRVPFPGDNGIQFEPVSTEGEEYVESLFGEGE